MPSFASYRKMVNKVEVGMKFCTKFLLYSIIEVLSVRSTADPEPSFLHNSAQRFTTLPIAIAGSISCLARLKAAHGYAMLMVYTPLPLSTDDVVRLGCYQQLQD